jgi:hypothetical protein
MESRSSGLQGQGVKHESSPANARLRRTHMLNNGASLASCPHFDNGGLCVRLNGVDAQDI